MKTTYPMTAVPGYESSTPGLQIASQMSRNVTTDEMKYMRQLGIEWVMTSVDEPELQNAAEYKRVVDKFASEDLKVFRLGNTSVHNMEEVTLALPDRDKKIDEYIRYLHDLSEAGLKYATYAHMGNGIWSSDRKPVRGGAQGRSLDLSKGIGHWAGKHFSGEVTHGRAFSEEELWDNFAYFLEKIVPEAEKAGVRIGIHPDDPPVYALGGIPRCIFGTFDGYKRALEMADSPNIGVCLCLGCWLEGGDAMGASPSEAIKYFAGQGKLFKIHFRNVTAPLPEGFTETLLDDGYMNMYEVMDALVTSGFDGAVISDHLPQTAAGRIAAESHAIGFIRGLLQAAQTQAGIAYRTTY